MSHADRSQHAAIVGDPESPRESFQCNDHDSGVRSTARSFHGVRTRESLARPVPRGALTVRASPVRVRGGRQKSSRFAACRWFRDLSFGITGLRGQSTHHHVVFESCWSTRIIDIARAIAIKRKSFQALSLVSAPRIAELESPGGQSGIDGMTDRVRSFHTAGARRTLLETGAWVVGWVGESVAEPVGESPGERRAEPPESGARVVVAAAAGARDPHQRGQPEWADDFDGDHGDRDERANGTRARGRMERAPRNGNKKADLKDQSVELH